MTETLINLRGMYVPDEADAEAALESSRRLSSITKRKSLSIRVESDGADESIPIPASLYRLLQDILTNMAQGNAITIVPTQAELTTQQAAEILNVSRPFVIQLIETNQLPHRMVGTHRRVLFQDVMDFKIRNREARMKVLDELVAEAQELDMGY